MKNRVTPLYPVHSSVMGRMNKHPLNMDRIKIPAEMRMDMTSVALSIFTDASNANVSFQAALLAVYLSGLQHGQAITLERNAA